MWIFEGDIMKRNKTWYINLSGYCIYNNILGGSEIFYFVTYADKYRIPIKHHGIGIYSILRSWKINNLILGCSIWYSYQCVFIGLLALPLAWLLDINIHWPRKYEYKKNSLYICNLNSINVYIVSTPPSWMS